MTLHFLFDLVVFVPDNFSIINENINKMETLKKQNLLDVCDTAESNEQWFDMIFF